ncbi:C-C motif chemokine 28 isoform X3 [Meles meles]|uniref:C-C motif chemokine 28 isoform X3 n=1 Tax=Meles meles TaxID=9662 RepID=UPI001E6995D1|nr:C-C motif chemokine 28 isoform X3 [Meles meles]
MASPTARSPLTLPDPQESDQDDLTRPDRSGLKKEPGLKERNMRSRYPSTSRGGASWLPFPPHVLLPRPPPAPFPDPLASPATQPGWGGRQECSRQDSLSWPWPPVWPFPTQKPYFPLPPAVALSFHIISPKGFWRE